MLCLYICLCITCVLDASRGQRGNKISYNWSDRWLWTTIWVFGVELGSSGIASSVPTPWVISPAHFFFPYHSPYPKKFRCAQALCGFIVFQPFTQPLPCWWSNLADFFLSPIHFVTGIWQVFWLPCLYQHSRRISVIEWLSSMSKALSLTLNAAKQTNESLYKIINTDNTKMKYLTGLKAEYTIFLI